MSGAASASAKKTMRGSDMSKYDKQRRQVDYDFQQGFSRPSQQPISYLQISSGSSQSTSNEQQNFLPENSSSSGAQQRFKRKKTQPYLREQPNSGMQISRQRGHMTRYIKLAY